MTRHSHVLVALAAALLLAAPAAATTYTYNCVACGGNSDAGELLSLNTTYDDDTELLTWSSTFGPSPSGALPKTGWLVVTDGDHPDTHPDNFAILYLGEDLERLTAYQYDPVRGGNSFENPAGLLEYFFFVVHQIDNPDGTRTINFLLDATNLNSLGYRVGFGPNIGLWFHPAAGGFGFNYPADGGISAHHFDSEGWYHVANEATVPEPSLAWLMALGLAGLFRAGSYRS